MHRFFIPSPDIAGNIVTIKETRVVHQMTKVLRMRADDVFAIFDEKGKEYSVKILELNRRLATGNIVETIKRKTDPKLKVALYQAIPKKLSLFELVIQKATEMGVAEIFPLITERTENRRLGKFERMKMIAIEATEQCGGIRVPTLRHPVNFEEVVKDLDHGYIAYELEKSKNIANFLPAIHKSKKVQILIGPEGGFSQKEVKLAEKAGLKSFTLGPRILRTETAAIGTLGAILLTQ